MAGKPVQRSGDFNTGGGIVLGGHNNVLINGKPVAKPGSLVTPHIKCSPKSPLHCAAVTLPTSKSVFVNGSPLVLTGGKDTCGHSRAGGSPDVLAL
jgi:uncharacterized Zn-binding protein involved in type VI secretion